MGSSPRKIKRDDSTGISVKAGKSDRKIDAWEFVMPIGMKGGEVEYQKIEVDVSMVYVIDAESGLKCHYEAKRPSTKDWSYKKKKDSAPLPPGAFDLPIAFKSDNLTDLFNMTRDYIQKGSKLEWNDVIILSVNYDDYLREKPDDKALRLAIGAELNVQCSLGMRRSYAKASRLGDYLLIMHNHVYEVQHVDPSVPDENVIAYRMRVRDGSVVIPYTEENDAAIDSILEGLMALGRRVDALLNKKNALDTIKKVAACQMNLLTAGGTDGKA
jgi:hypothetical protein